jgi:hypothetical protein
MIVQSELLVRVVDRTLVQGKLNKLRRNTGDVVAVMEAGHNWSEAERNNSFWIIIETDMPYLEACEFTAEMPYTRIEWPDKPPVKQHINLNALFQGIPTNSGTPYQVQAQDLRDHTVTKPVPPALAKGFTL